jgi:hypothetical protein
MGLDSALCLQGHTKWVGDFSMFVGVYKDDNTMVRAEKCPPRTLECRFLKISLYSSWSTHFKMTSLGFLHPKPPRTKQYLAARSCKDHLCVLVKLVGQDKFFK